MTGTVYLYRTEPGLQTCSFFFSCCMQGGFKLSQSMNLKITCATISVLLLSLTGAWAQNGRTYEGPNKMNTWSVTGYGGITRFFGDLRQHNFAYGEKETLTGAWGLSLNKQITPLFGAQITFSNGSLSGSKKDVQG